MSSSNSPSQAQGQGQGIPDDPEQEADLPLTMAASVVLTSLPKDSKTALVGAGDAGVPVKGIYNFHYSLNRFHSMLSRHPYYVPSLFISPCIYHSPSTVTLPANQYFFLSDRTFPTYSGPRTIATTLQNLFLPAF